MPRELLLWSADALVVLGVAIMTIGVYGVIRMPDVYTQLHAASKSVFVGVVSLCLASIVTSDPGIIARVFLITVLLLLTTPVSSHVIARGAYLEGQRMEAPGAIGESDRDLTTAGLRRHRAREESVPPGGSGGSRAE